MRIYTPASDLPCGPKNPQALLPEPQHYDCAECRRIIQQLLLSRRPQARRPKPKEEQLTLFELTKKQRRRPGARGAE
jgi:hypothetical protein